MLSEQKIAKARENFLLAAKDFGFVFHSPFPLTDDLTAFGYIENYGSENGAVVCLSSSDCPSDPNIFAWCRQNHYFCSFINVEVISEEYERSYFREMLRDWGRF